MANTKFGWQPAKQIIKSMGMSVDQAALELRVQSNHLRNALYGNIIPGDEVRAGLPKLTGRPLEELFTPEVLNHQDRRGGTVRKQCGCICSEHSFGNVPSDRPIINPTRTLGIDR